MYIHTYIQYVYTCMCILMHVHEYIYTGTHISIRCTHVDFMMCMKCMSDIISSGQHMHKEGNTRTHIHHRDRYRDRYRDRHRFQHRHKHIGLETETQTLHFRLPHIPSVANLYASVCTRTYTCMHTHTYKHTNTYALGIDWAKTRGSVA